MTGEIVKAGEVIDGEYEVVLPPRPVSWSFWRDDLPAVLHIVVTGLIAIPVLMLIHRLFS